MQIRKNKFLLTIIITVIVLCMGITYILAADAGSEGDPVVSLSYIEKVLIPKIYGYIDERFAAAGQAPTNDSFIVILVFEGQKLIGLDGAEFILRMGTAQVIASERGGLADVTQGSDLKNNENVPANHHLIVPLNDGRGILASNDLLVMVKGGYEIK